jgi:hypothetical protein
MRALEPHVGSSQTQRRGVLHTEHSHRATHPLTATPISLADYAIQRPQAVSLVARRPASQSLDLIMLYHGKAKQTILYRPVQKQGNMRRPQQKTAHVGKLPTTRRHQFLTRCLMCSTHHECRNTATRVTGNFVASPRKRLNKFRKQPKPSYETVRTENKPTECSCYCGRIHCSGNVRVGGGGGGYDGRR